MKTLTTQKLFYKKYDHRITLKIVTESVYKRTKKAERSTPTESVLTYILDQQFPNDVFRIAYRTTYIGRGTRNGVYRYGRAVTSATVYFKNPKILEFIQGQFSTDIEVIEKPLDAAHAELLETTKMMTRSKLFLNKYRWVARVKPIWKNYSYRTEHIEEMKKYVKKNMKHLVNLENYTVRGHHNCSFYFENASDLVLFKMVWNEYISEAIGITLLSELDSSSEKDESGSEKVTEAVG
jgi:hypothetical protein